MPSPVAVYAALLLAALVPASASASKIKASPYRDGVSIVSVVGPLEPGDGERFAAVVSGVGKALVALNADGGDIAAGIGIAREVNARDMGTLVGAKATCVDACAVAWLGGARRYLEPGARVGFASGTLDPGAAAFLEGLPLTEEAFAFVAGTSTSAPRMLDEATAAGLGLRVETGHARPQASDSKVANAIGKAARDFRKAYEDRGISGVLGDVRDCYVAVGSGSALERVAYCHALDRIAMTVDATVSVSLGFEPQAYLAPERVRGRLDEALSGSGGPPVAREALVRELDARTDAAFAKSVSAD